jgi:hypothetical protein
MPPLLQGKREILFKIRAYVTVVMVSDMYSTPGVKNANLLARSRKVKMAFKKRKENFSFKKIKSFKFLFVKILSDSGFGFNKKPGSGFHNTAFSC